MSFDIAPRPTLGISVLGGAFRRKFVTPSGAEFAWRPFSSAVTEAQASGLYPITHLRNRVLAGATMTEITNKAAPMEGGSAVETALVFSWPEAVIALGLWLTVAWAIILGYGVVKIVSAAM